MSDVEKLQYERRIVAPFVGGIGWRSLFNVTWAIGGWAGVIAAYAAGRLPLWGAIVLATVFIQALYMPVHEAVHRTISGGQDRLRWLDDLVGAFAAWLLCASFAEHRVTHILHHAHTNGNRDPDVINSRGTLLQVIGRVPVGAVLYLFSPLLALVPSTRALLPRALASSMQRMAELRGAQASRAGTMAAATHLLFLIAGSLTGYGGIVWLLWYVPAWISRIWLSVVFAWLPHNPHVETGRYRDTRVLTFPGSSFLIRGHDYHLLHHLYPRVPHYRLRQLWREIGAHLQQQGCRIEGPALRQLRAPATM